MRVRHILLVVAPALFLTGCQSWQATAEPPRTLVSQQEPSSLRITTRTSERHTLQNPSVTMDSIFGDGQFGGRVGFGLDQIQVVEERRFSAVRTIFVGGIAVLGYSLFRWFFDKPQVE